MMVILKINSISTSNYRIFLSLVIGLIIGILAFFRTKIFTQMSLKRKLRIGKAIKDYAMQLKNDEEAVRKIIQCFATDIDEKMQEYLDESFLMIRPSGNPLDLNGWISMMQSADVKVKDLKLIAVNTLEVTKEMAYCCFTQHSKFEYKGVENDDIAVLTAILKKAEGKWKITLVQRSTGRKPTEPLPFAQK
eukprot:304116_1